MSRGRGGPPREHYHCRYPPPHLQPKESYYRPGPAPFSPRPAPPHGPYSSYHNTHPGAPGQPPPPPPLIPSDPSTRHLRPPSAQSHFAASSDSFRHQQAEFLRGRTSEAPHFRGGPTAGLPRYQSDFGRYQNPSSSRGRGGYSQEQDLSFPTGAQVNRYQNQHQGPRTQGPSQYQRPNHQQGPNQYQAPNHSRPCPNTLTQEDVFERFKGLSLHRDKHSKTGEQFRSSGQTRGVFNAPPDIQNQVYRALAALNPTESVSAKTLAKKLRVPRKVVNQALYALKSSKKAHKEEVQPPLWSLYRERLPGNADQNHQTQSPQPPQPTLVSSDPQEPDVKVESVEEILLKREIEEDEEDSDSESSSSSTGYQDSKYLLLQTPPPTCGGSPNLEPKSSGSMMADQKELVLQYLLKAGEATALVIAKNVGFRTAKQINPTLYELEKSGEVTRNTDSNPARWELSDHRREKMERTLKAAQSSDPNATPMEQEGAVASSRVEPGAGPEFSDIPFLDPSALLEGCLPTPSQSETPLPFPTMKEEETSEGQWATDDIPEFLNAIRREIEVEKLSGEQGNAVGTVAVSVAAPPPQNLWAKLQEVRLKNPVSGLMEYAQYLGHNCEFQLLDQSGPSHDPRFRMQVMLNGRLFPIAEASSKKVAKKDAAAATLQILIREMQGGKTPGEEGHAPSADSAMELLPDASGSVDSLAGGFGSSDAEGVSEGPRQLLSRSLPGGKNPVSVLMEYSQRSGKPIEFIITGQAGPPHDPRFMYRVKVGENLFAEASAPSKKAARQLAAEEAVKELMADGKLQLNKPQLPLGPSSSDTGDLGGSGTLCPSLPPLTADELRAAHEAGVGDLINHLNNNAVSGLLEYARARGFAAEIRLVGQSGPPHEPKFTYQAKLGGRWFPPVCASNKKQGKHEAADAALRVLIGEAEKAARTGELIPAELPVSGSTLHDQIAMLSHQRFNALTTRIQHSLLGRKILATIVMRRGEGLGTVVSLGTGNRCVKGEELSLKGETVNDCHAEIISRRGFVRFLYSELLKHYEGAEESIFEPTEDNRLRIKQDITFHLYISTAPCGDGALFDKSCSESGDEVEGHQPLFENAKQGKLRTKVENGEGTIPVESSAIVPTWDGIQHGERLRTMSCSDKILRWNVMGLQGALLTHFLEPIYLKSITLGYLYSHGHLTRAVCCRLARDGEAFAQSLPPPFRLNHPEVGRVSVYDSTRHTGKTKESSVNWSFPDQHSVEVLDGTKGKQDGNKLAVSRVSKSNLFALFRVLCQRCGRVDLLPLPSYSQAKMAAASFQRVKRQFFEALNVHGYGAWIGKPLEEKSFEERPEEAFVGGGVGGGRNNGNSLAPGYGRNGATAVEMKTDEV